jgi:hypothetical protein
MDMCCLGRDFSEPLNPENKTTMKNKLVLCVSTLAVASAVSASADIVYDNSTTRVNVGGVDQGYSSGNEFGDQIILGGSARDVTQFSFEYFLKVNSGVSTGLETARIRFYKNDGPQVNVTGFAPGTLLWDSGDFSIPVSDALAYDLAVPNITVPNTFTWTVSFGNVLGTETAGLSMYDPPTVGNGFDDYWENNGGTWELRKNSDPSIATSFGGIVEAVPEPGTVTLGALAGAALVGYMMKRRKNS